MTKIIIICQAFRLKFMFDRWRMLTQTYKDLDLLLIGPRQWKNSEFGFTDATAAEAIDEDRFRVIPVKMVDRIWTLGSWDSPEITAIIKEYRPDLIYLIGVETADILFRVAIAKSLFVPRAKLCCFTMRGLDLPTIESMLRSGWKSLVFGLNFWVRWKLAIRIIDAFFTHYPHGAEVLQKQGNFKKPVYMQTQVGVDARVYKPDEQARQDIRKRLGLKDEFVFGSLSRMDIRKGLLDILDALPLETNSKFIMIGDGPDMDQVKMEVKKRNLEKYVILPGFVERNEPVNAFLNALDGFVHVPQVWSDHLDTFPLVVPQAMAVGLPIIAADNGGAPYQLGNKGVLVPTSDPKSLREAMTKMATDRKSAKLMGEALRIRFLTSFEIRHLNDCFFYTVRDILEGRFNTNHIDQQNFTF